MPIRKFDALMALARPYSWCLPILVCLGVIASLAEGMGIGLLIPLLDTLLTDKPLEGVPGPLVRFVKNYAHLFDEETRFIVLGVSVIGLIVVKTAVVSTYICLSSWVATRIADNGRRALIHQLLSVGYVYLSDKEPGRLVNTVVNETTRMLTGLHSMFQLVIHCCTVLVFTCLLLLISWEMTLTTVFGVVLASLVVRIASRQAKRQGDYWVNANQQLMERSMGILRGMRVVRAFGQEAREQGYFDEASKRLQLRQFRTEVLTKIVHPLTEMLYVPLFLGAVLVALYLDLGLGTLFAFLLLLYRVQPHLRGVDLYRVMMAGFSGAADDVNDLLRSADKPYVKDGTEAFEGLRSSVSFQSIDFRYGVQDKGPAALDDVSFDIRKGETLAIIGGSGAGKSTLIHLLCRFYDPERGEILVDGRALRSLKLADWRSKLAIAGQDADLVTGSIRENIAYGEPDASEEQIVAAAKRAHAHDFIVNLPKGYDTAVGERGLKLSGGQRQRIGLARALLRSPEILILDEATNALDSISERAIQATLDELAGQLTIVVIAHRLSTLRNANRVIVMEQGRVAEQGTPQALLDSDGLLARYYDLQRLGLSTAVPGATRSQSAEREVAVADGLATTAKG